MSPKEKDPSGSSTIASLSIEQTHRAMSEFLRHFQSNISTLPWGQSDLTKRVAGYAEQNLVSVFSLTEKLSQAQNLQEVVTIQSEYLQTQLHALAEQAKDIGETATKTTVDAVARTIKPGKA
jgi:hypothetical protein